MASELLVFFVALTVQGSAGSALAGLVEAATGREKKVGQLAYLCTANRPNLLPAYSLHASFLSKWQVERFTVLTRGEERKKNVPFRGCKRIRPRQSMADTALRGW